MNKTLEDTPENYVFGILFITCLFGGIWLGYWKGKQLFAARGWIGVIPSLISLGVAVLLSGFLWIWFAARMLMKFSRFSRPWLHR